MEKISFLAILLVLPLFASCSYKVPTQVSPAVNIYSSYGDKISGDWILVIDDSVTDYNKEIKPSSYLCGAHKFPVDIDQSIALSIRETCESIFENIIEQKTMPTLDYLVDSNSMGSIYVRMKRFYPTIRFASGFWSGSAIATCDLVLEVSVKDRENNKLLITSVGGNRTSDGSAGQGCSGGATVLSEAMYMTVRETMERFSERVSNSKRIRDYCAQDLES